MLPDLKFVSTRKGLTADAVETVFRGLAPDGGLYVPERIVAGRHDLPLCELADAERYVAECFFGAFPKRVREEAVGRVVSRFPSPDPMPLVSTGRGRECYVFELFHGRTGAFKDVALSMLPVFMRHAAKGRRVLVLAATSGDTGSAAMEGFSGVEGTEVAVLYPETGISQIQRLQMTTQSAPNVHAIAIRGNFDDAQAAVKRIFADKAFNAEANAHGVALTSANSINTGRLVPQIGYFVMLAERMAMIYGNQYLSQARQNIVLAVPSGNFGNILAAYYAKKMGMLYGKLVCASNVNDVLARFIATGIYEPGDKFTVTNSPSMDIRNSSNVERLVWLLNDGDCDEVSRLMNDLATKGRYELNDKAKERLFEDFAGGVATPEETEQEMREIASHGYIMDPHTAVASCVAHKLGYPKGREPLVIAATATPYKFPDTCMHAFGRDLLLDPPQWRAELEKRPVCQKKVVDVAGIDDAVMEIVKRG